MSSKKKISNPNKYIDKSFQGFQMLTIKAKGNKLYPAGKQSLIKLDFWDRTSTESQQKPILGHKVLDETAVSEFKAT